MGQINKTTAQINEILDKMDMEYAIHAYNMFKHIITVKGTAIIADLDPEHDNIESNTTVIEIINSCNYSVLDELGGPTIADLFESTDFNPIGSYIYNIGSSRGHALILGSTSSHLITTDSSFNSNSAFGDISETPIIEDWVLPMILQ